MSDMNAAVKRLIRARRGEPVEPSSDREPDAEATKPLSFGDYLKGRIHGNPDDDRPAA